MNVHTPVSITYAFPPEAFKVQTQTAILLIENTRAYCLNELGTGKTRSVLYAFDALKKAGMVRRMLVICPLSALDRTWLREIRMYFPHLTAVILHGDKKRRLLRLTADVDIYIINHDGLGTIFDALVSRHDIDVVCVDELSGYRDGRSNRTKTLREYVQPIKFVWGLTGSPIPRAVTDVWGPCSCITPWSVPKYFTLFRDQLMVKDPFRQFKFHPKPGAEERAVACMQPSVRYKLDDVVELPLRVRNYYEAEMTPSQAAAYESMRKFALTMYEEKRIDALNAGAVLNKLLQISIGYGYTRDGEVVRFDNTPRLQLILDLIDSAAHKVLLFAPYKSAVAALSKMLHANKILHAVVTGDTPLKERNKIFSAFQETPEYKVILAHPACMSHSLTLTAANTTIWAGPVTSLDIFTQANARTYRVGQQHKTLVAMVGGTGVEKRMYKLLGANEDLQNKFLELIESLTERDN